MRRSHSSRLPRKPSSQAVSKLNRALKGNVIETHEHKGDFKEPWRDFVRRVSCSFGSLLSVHKIGNQATQSRIAWLPEEHNLMGIVVFGEMPSRSFYGFFGMKLPKTCSRRKEHSMPLHMSNQPMKPTAPPRNAFRVVATTPCRGLSLSR